MALTIEKQKVIDMLNMRLNFMNKPTHKIIFLIFFIGSLLNGCASPDRPHLIASSTPFIEDKPSIDVCFSPKGKCQPIILNLINNARKKIFVQSYSFTSQNIANALIKAHQRRIKVKILFDRSQLTAKHSQIHKMKEAGIETLVDLVPGIAHNKVMIIDDELVITGSYNWTNAAEIRNAENLLIIKDQSTSNIYNNNWDKRYQRAKQMNLKNELIKYKREIKLKMAS